MLLGKTFKDALNMLLHAFAKVIRMANIERAVSFI